MADQVLADAERGEMDVLQAKYHAIRRMVGSASGRLYPSGRLVRLATRSTSPSFGSNEMPHSDVDEMVVTTDMVMAHMPRRYLQAVREAVASGACVKPLWGKQVLDADGVSSRL